MEKKIFPLFFDNILLLLAYYLTAHLSLSFLSVPSTNAVIIWPPTGIALAAVLLKGNRVLPVVFLAATIIAIELMEYDPFITIVFSFIVGFQAMFTAWSGARLIRHFIGVANPLVDSKSIALFFLFAGPVSLILPAALTMGGEYWLGMIKGSEFLTGFFIWWLGGSIGAIIFAPIVLILLGGESQRARITTFVVPIVLLFMLLVWAFFHISNIEKQRFGDTFNLVTDVLLLKTQNQFDTAQPELHELKSLIEEAVYQAKMKQVDLNVVGLGLMGRDVFKQVNQKRYGIEVVKKISVPGYPLIFSYYPSEAFFLHYSVLPVRWVFALGLGLTGVLGFTLLTVTGHTIQIQRKVGKKTQALHRERQLLQTVLDNIEEGIVACNEKGDLTVFNQAAEKICGKKLTLHAPSKWAEGVRVETLHGENLLAVDERPLLKLMEFKRVRDFEFSLVLSERSKKVLKVNSAQLVNGQKQLIGMVASFQNVTKQKLVLSELKKLSWTVEYSPVSILITDYNGYIDYINRKFIDMTGYSRGDLDGKKPAYLSAGKTPDRIYKGLWRTLMSGQEWRGEFLNRKKDGQCYWSKQLIAPIVNEQKQITHFVAIQEDITEQKQAIEVLSHQASHDELTGLLNRRECEARLDRVIQSAQLLHSNHAFCFLDLDKFKIVNDTCGHRAGDFLLREVCDLFKQQLRQRDTLARLGGDEFGIVMEHCSITQGKDLANKICQVIADYEFMWEGQVFKIGVSIGLVAIDKNSASYTTTVSLADDACYAAKKSGRGRVCVAGE